MPKTISLRPTGTTSLILLNATNVNQTHFRSAINQKFRFIGEYVWATICLRKQKLGVYYRAKDQNTAVLIKQFEYELTEVVKYLRHDICKAL